MDRASALQRISDSTGSQVRELVKGDTKPSRRDCSIGDGAIRPATDSVLGLQSMIALRGGLLDPKDGVFPAVVGVLSELLFGEATVAQPLSL